MNMIIAFKRHYKKVIFDLLGVDDWLDLFYCCFAYTVTSIWIMIMIIIPPIFFISFLAGGFA